MVEVAVSTRHISPTRSTSSAYCAPCCGELRGACGALSVPLAASAPPLAASAPPSLEKGTRAEKV